MLCLGILSPAGRLPTVGSAPFPNTQPTTMELTLPLPHGVHHYAMLLSCPFLLSCSAVKDVTHETGKDREARRAIGAYFFRLISS